MFLWKITVIQTIPTSSNKNYWQVFLVYLKFFYVNSNVDKMKNNLTQNLEKNFLQFVCKLFSLITFKTNNCLERLLINFLKSWYSKTRVTSYELRVESLKAQAESLKDKLKFKSASSNPQVTTSDPRVTSSNPRVTSLDPRVASSNPLITSSNPRVTSSNSRVQESLNQWKLK